MGRIGIGLRAGLSAALTLGACGEAPHVPDPQETSAQATASAKAAAIIMGTIVHTENKAGEQVGVRAYADPHDLRKAENGFYKEGDRIGFVCSEIGRLGVDSDVPGPDAVQWSVWNKVADSPNNPQQWIPQPYAHTDQPLPRCEATDLPSPSTPQPTGLPTS